MSTTNSAPPKRYGILLSLDAWAVIAAFLLAGIDTAT